MPETDDIVEIPSDVNEARAKRSGYWADDEPDEEFALADDDDQWNEEDITTPAQADLEVHREVREYTRIAAWDLPLLLRKYERSKGYSCLNGPLMDIQSTFRQSMDG